MTNEKTIKSFKGLPLLGAVTFAVLLILALLLYKERVGLSDTAYHLFTILKNDSFAIQNNRYVAALTQMFPLIGGKLSLSLATVAKLYSAAFVLVQCVIFYFILFVIKNKRAALAYLLFLTLMTAHTFFWVQSELPQGVGFLFLYFAYFDSVVKKNGLKPISIFISLVLITTVAYAHPLLIFPFVFFHAFLFRTDDKINKLVVLAVITYIVVAMARTFIFRASYETTAFEGLKNFKYLFPDYFTIQSNKNFIRYMLTDYYFLILLFVTNCIFYLNNKAFYKLFITIAFFAGFTLLVNVCYHGGGNQFYYENQYLLLSVFVIIPFLYDVLPFFIKQYSSKLLYIIPCIIVLVCFMRIGLTSKKYTAMLDWKREAIDNMSDMKDKRVIIHTSQIPDGMVLDNWSNPYEFWFISTLEKGYSQATLIAKTKSEYDWTWDKYDTFFTELESTPYAELRPPYFLYPESTAYERYTPE